MASRCCLLGVALLVALLTTPVRGERQASAGKAVNVQVKKTDVSFAPESFDPSLERLPANFAGTDVQSLYWFVDSKAKQLARGEFETTVDFEKRVAEAQWMFAPLPKDASFAFLLPNLKAKYYPDDQVYVISSDSGDVGCLDASAYSQSEKEVGIACDLKSIVLERTKYAGVTSFGAETKVSKLVMQKIGIVFSNEGLARKFFTRSGASKSFEFESELYIPIERARKISGNKIGVLLVGRLSGARIVLGPAVFKEPTLTSPSNVSMIRGAIPVLATHIIYFVVETGEILQKISINL